VTRNAVESDVSVEARESAREQHKAARESAREQHEAAPERALTRDRDETKYVIHPLRIAGLLRVLSAELNKHRYTGEGANRLPDAQHYTTTVYFDTASRALYRAARENPVYNQKLRARAYYDVHSSLAELATSPDQFVRQDPWIFLELKQRDQTRTSKHRLRLKPTELVSFLGAGMTAEALGNEQSSDRAAILDFCSSRSEPLAPSAVVSYRRVSFEDGAGALRVTLDLDVAFFAPPRHLFQTERALLRGGFGKPVGSAPLCLLEVKRRSETPAWLARALEDSGAREETFSKFILASEAVHGSP
jgi:hypothetical protein